MKKNNRNKIVNLRKDIFTNKRYLKNEMIKLVKKLDNTLELDIEQTKEGRGIYIHPDSLERVNKSDNLLKYFNKKNYKVSDELISELKFLEKNGKK